MLVLVTTIYVSIEVNAIVNVIENKLLQPLYSNVAYVSAARSRRQTNGNADEICPRIYSNVACSLSFGQNYISALSKCGDRATNDIATFEHFL